MSTERHKFWMVWRENGGAPTYQHWEKAAAVTEAERLAKQSPGSVFFILKATAAVVSPEPQVERVKLVHDPIPF